MAYAYLMAAFILILVLFTVTLLYLIKTYHKQHLMRFLIVITLIAYPAVAEDVIVPTQEHPILWPNELPEATEKLNVELYHWLEAPEFWLIDIDAEVNRTLNLSNETDLFTA